jgi:hypothetical protein
MAEILVGASGYPYDDWRGPYYPLQLKRGDMLEYYAREFWHTEVNSAYYALPAQQTTARLAEKTPPGLANGERYPFQKVPGMRTTLKIYRPGYAKPSLIKTTYT